MKLALHGGAGNIPKKLQPERAEILEKAARDGLACKNPLAAVEKAINVLEDHPLFNAGYGGSLQHDGEVRLDASIMRADLSCGSVTGIKGIKHAVSVARKVMEESPHVFLGGEGANNFAHEFGFAQEDLREERAIEKWRGLLEEIGDLSYRETLAAFKRKGRERTVPHSGEKDTVGAVAVDEGQMVAATSTAGRTVQMQGRIGDSPIIGSGVYCNESGAVSTTGVGEAIIPVCLARQAIYELEKGKSPQQAADEAISFLAEKTRSHAGLLLLDDEGEVSAAYNTRDMQYVVMER